MAGRKGLGKDRENETGSFEVACHQNKITKIFASINIRTIFAPC